MNTTLASCGHNRPGKAALIIMALSTSLLLTISGTARAQLLETQTFDSEASASAAGWTEFGSRINNFDFGYSSTNHAEGTASGEGGGRIARSEPLGYYADLTLGDVNDLSIDLHATGRLKFQDSNYDGEFFFGFFDKDQAEANNTDYLGIHVREPRNGLWRVLSSIDGNDGVQLNITDDTALNFEIDWDADGGAAVGDGRLMLTLTTLDGLQTLESTVEGFDGMTVNAFGLLNLPQGGNLDQVGDFFFDDLSYTGEGIPEPSSLLLAALGLLGLLGCGRRRRRAQNTHIFATH